MCKPGIFKIRSKNKFSISVFFFILAIGSSLTAETTENEIASSSLEQISSTLKSSRSKKRQPLPNTWKPYFAKHTRLYTMTPFVANLNVGIGFLYFAGNHGSFNSNEAISPNQRVDLDYSTNGRDSLSHRWQYNRVPLTEACLIWNLGGTFNSLDWIGLGLTLLYQGNVFIRYVSKGVSDNAVTKTYLIFSSNVNFCALGPKIYLYSPYTLVWKRTGYLPYIGLITGPSWQTWGQIYRETDNEFFNSFLNSQICANAFFGSEVGVMIKSIARLMSLTANLGIKFNLWGQARNLGKISKQNKSNTGLYHPFRIKTIYQWSPFIGISISY